MGAIESRDFNEPEKECILIEDQEDFTIDEYHYNRWNIRLYVEGKLIIESNAIGEITA